MYVLLIGYVLAAAEGLQLYMFVEESESQTSDFLTMQAKQMQL